jgi:two-component system NarL family response regulator
MLLQGELSTTGIESFASAEEAIQHADWDQADILLTDINLPGMNGVQLISWAHLNHSAVVCMAHTIFDNRDTVFSAIKAGACGYLLKGASPRELIESLVDIYHGGSPMSPHIARKVLQHLHETKPETDNQLTAREQAVLRLLEKGLSYKEAADELNISPHTVHSYIKSAYEKVQATSRDELLNKARRLGWM